MAPKGDGQRSQFQGEQDNLFAAKGTGEGVFHDTYATAIPLSHDK